jgi:glycosyltransferase involved in cell wall biosynthesis
MRDRMVKTNPDVSIILPCQDEEHSLAESLHLIQSVFKEHAISGEIIVSDSSSDASPEIAKAFDVIVHKHDQDGYGRAILEGVRVARGAYLFIADPDGSYDFREIPRFIAELESGYELVIGNRFQGTIAKGAMPWMHQYIGKVFFTLCLAFLYRSFGYDVHCGMRALSRETFNKLNLVAHGMEFASEMLIKSVQQKLRIKQLPIHYGPRLGASKLKTFRDGLRHCSLIFQLAN